MDAVARGSGHRRGGHGISRDAFDELVSRVSGSVTSLSIHSQCAAPVTKAEGSNGCFWDTGFGAELYGPSDHCSPAGAAHQYLEVDSRTVFDEFTASPSRDGTQSGSP